MSVPRALAAAALVLLSGMLPCAAAAPRVVVYRCTAADGAVMLQNGRRCPKGMREERRVLEVATSRAAPAVLVPPPAVPVDAVSTAAADATPLVEFAPSPAPPLFACRTWEGQRYYGDSAQPAPRCAPLETVGLDRRSATSAQACEVVPDSCEAVVETARCDAWAERLRTAEGLERFGDDAAAARTEAARVRTVIAATVCAR